MSNLEEQEDEISSLRAILNEEYDDVGDSGVYGDKLFSVKKCVQGDGKNFEGLIKVQVNLGGSILQVHYHWSPEQSEGDCPSSEVKEETFQVSYLPPILLEFKLPQEYPQNQAPEYNLTCEWLTNHQLEVLRQELDRIWSENNNSVILFHWYSFLREEMLETLNIANHLDISDIVRDFVSKLNQDRRERLEREAKAEKEKKSSQVKMKEDNLMIFDDDKSEEITAKRLENTETKRDLSHETKGDNPEKGFQFGGESHRRKLLDVIATKKMKELQQKDLKKRKRQMEQKLKQHRVQEEGATLLMDDEKLWDKDELDDEVEEEDVGKHHQRSKEGGNEGISSFSSLKLEDFESEEVRMERNIQILRKAYEYARKKLDQGAVGNLKKYKQKAERKWIEAPSSEEVHQGRLIKWLAHRNFGFIKLEASKETIFVHRKSIQLKNIPEKDEDLAFNIIDNESKGKKEAVNVTKKSFLEERQSKVETESNPETDKNIVKEFIVDKVYKVLVDPKTEELLMPPKPSTAHADQNPKTSRAEKSETESKHFKEIFALPGLIKYLKEFNELEEERQFNQKHVFCDICYDDKMGIDCMRFSKCKHTFCRECLSQYFTVRIGEGAVNSLTCPEDKCESQALPSQVKELVPEDVFSRYESQLLETTLQGMNDVILCPRRFCQTAVIIDRKHSLASCPNENCNYVFCIYCKATYHGVQPCRIKRKEYEALIKEYMSANEAGKGALERRYGKRQLTSMVNEHLSEQYKETNSKRCPRCSVPIQKLDGCNKMTCNKCGTFFCYICGEQCPRQNPYLHYNTPGSQCFSKLFEGVEMIDDDEFFEEEDEDGFIFFL